LLLIGKSNNILSLQTKRNNTAAPLIIKERGSAGAINSFNNMFNTRVKAANRIGPRYKYVVSVIIGSLLGNCATIRSVEGTRLVYKKSIVHKD
jgi:hypothetical protein